MGYFFIIVGEDRLVGFVTSNKSSENKNRAIFFRKRKNHTIECKIY